MRTRLPDCLAAAALALLLLLPPARAENLLPGDPDLETECRSMTYGTWGATVPGDFRNRAFSIDEKSPYAGGRSLRITGANEFSALETRILPKGVYTFSVMARSDRDGVTAFLGATPFHRPTYATRARNRRTVTLHRAWERHAYTFTADGSHRYVVTYGLDSKDASACLDCFRLNPGGAPEPLRPVPAVGIGLPEAEGNVFLLGERIPVTVLATTGSPVDVQVRDHLGKEVLRRSGPSPLAFQLPGDRRGWFGISAGSGGARDFQSLVVVPPPRRLSGRTLPFAGLCGAQALPEAARRIGVRWIEGVVNWFYAEEKKDVYDFEYLLDYAKVKRLRDQGFAVKALLYLCAPAWLQSQENRQAAQRHGLSLMRFAAPPESDPRFRRFLREFLARYGNDFDIMECGGELDAAFGLNPHYKQKHPGQIVGGFAAGPLAGRCAELIDAACEEIRRTRPDAGISAVRPSDVDARHGYAFTEEILRRCRARPGIDTMGLDCYPQPRWIGPGQPPPGLERNLKRNHDAMAAILARHAPGCRLIVSEYGYFLDREHSFEQPYQMLQANRLARSFLYGRAVGFQAFFYFIASFPDNLLEADRFTMSLWRLGNPSSAVAAYSAAAEVVEDVTRTHFTRLSDKLTVVTFGHVDGSGTTAMWSTDPDYTPRIRFGAGEFRFSDMMGAPLPSGDLRLGENPVYAAGGGFEAMRRAAEDIRIEEDLPAELFFRPAAADRLKCYVVNHSSRDPQTGFFEWRLGAAAGRTEPFVVPPGGRSIVALPMPPPEGTLSLVLNFEGDYRPWACEYTAPEIPAVGKDPLVIVLDTGDRILPLDHTVWKGPDDLSMRITLACRDGILAFRAVVKDDRHCNRHRGRDVWKGDCVQIGIHPRTNFLAPAPGRSVEKEDYIMTLALDADGHPALQLHERPDDGRFAREARFDVRRDDPAGETTYTLDVPLQAIDPILAPGRIFGFSCLAMEDDTGAGADHWISLSPGIAGERRPDLFKLFFLK